MAGSTNMRGGMIIFKAIRVLMIAAIFFLFPIPGRAEILSGASEARLSNGLKIIMVENHSSPIVSFQVWYRAGSRNERTGKTGLAHMLEHMMFKGTHKVSGENFVRMIYELGGEQNASTSNDSVVYYETLASDRIAVPIDFESDRMVNLVLQESDFRTERMVVMEERRMRVDDNPQSFLSEQLDAAAYQSQPYHWPVIGWPEDIERLTIDDVRSFYSTYYTPSNAFIVVAGDFKKETLLPMLEKAFGQIPAGKPAQQLFLQDPPQSGEKRVLVERPAHVGAVTVGWHVPNIRSEDCYVLEIIKSILSDGKSSRLYDHLVRGKALVLDSNVDYTVTTQDPGLFYVTATFLPDRKAEEIENAIYEELELLKKNPIGDREIEKAKNQCEAAFVFEQESVFSLGEKLAQYEIALDWTAISAYIPSIRKVTPGDVQRVASKYFTSQNRNVGVLKPSRAPEKSPEQPGSQPAGGMKDRSVRLK
jgi:zinc protease